MQQSHWLLCVAKEFWLVQENHASVRLAVKLDSSVAPRGVKTYSESNIELRNLQILKKMLEKWRQFLSSQQSCELNSLDVALDIAGVEKLSSENLQLQSTLEAIQFEFWMKEALATVEICVLCGWRFLIKSLWYSVGDTL